MKNKLAYKKSEKFPYLKKILLERAQVTLDL